MGTDRKRASTKLTAKLCLSLLLFQVFLFAPPNAFARNTSVGTIANRLPKQQTTEFEFKYSLSEGKCPSDPTTDATPLAPTQNLSESETQALLKRLPEMQQQATTASLSLPVHPIPPPTAAHYEQIPFPPPAPSPESCPQTTSAPLTVTNKRPEGDVPSASNLAVSFSQPMVPVTSHNELSGIEPPVSISPKVEGTWQWVSSQTALFVPKNKRFPMATKYSVTVPSGTKALNGHKLESNVSWSFSTPAPDLVQHYPEWSQVKPSTIVMMRFDQKVSPAAVLALTKVTSHNRTIPIVEASLKDVKDDEAFNDSDESNESDESTESTDILKLALRPPGGTAVFFKAPGGFPKDSSIKVQIGRGAPSLEGSEISKSPSEFEFQTYGPLTFKKPRRSIEAGGLIPLEFSNAIDPKSFEPSTLKVTPPLEVTTQFYGSTLWLSGPTKAGTIYKINVSDSLRDEFGQNLTGTRNHEFKVVATSRAYSAPTQTTIPLGYPAHLNISSRRISTLIARVFSVEPDMFRDFMTVGSQIPAAAKLLTEETVNLNGKDDEVHNEQYDLTRWLNNKPGHLIVELTDPLAKQDEKPRQYWVTATKLAIDAYTTSQQLVTWVTNIADGHPLPGAQVQVNASSLPTSTNANGVARIDRLESELESNRYRPSVVIARQGDDSAVLQCPSRWNHASKDAWGLRWYTVSDRSPYCPGETIHVKGLIRETSMKAGTAPVLLMANVPKIMWKAHDSRGLPIAEGKSKVNRFGAFDFELKLPKSVNLGDGYIALEALAPARVISLSTPRSSSRLSFQVQEFRRPEFSLQIKNEGEPIQMVGHKSQFSAEAKYYTGGPLAKSKIDWRVRAEPGSYTPPGWRSYQFGAYVYELAALKAHKVRQSSLAAENLTQSYSGITSASGRHCLELNLESVEPSIPCRLLINATVQDVNRQKWTDSTSVLVHPSAYYIGMKQDRNDCKVGQEHALSLVLTDIGGKVVPNQDIQIEVSHEGTDTTSNEADQKTDVKSATMKSASEPVTFKFVPNSVGLYNLTATVRDASGRKNIAFAQLWARKPDKDQSGRVQIQRLIAKSDKTSYEPGETAKVRIETPFAPAHGLATLWYNGLARELPFEVTGTVSLLEIPLSENDMPVAHVELAVVGSSTIQDKQSKAPAEALGSIDLKVSTDSRCLNVKVKPSVETTKPGADVAVDVAVTDHSGKAVANAEIALGVVDQALLSLVDYKFSSPMSTFYEAPPRSPLDHNQSRTSIELNEILQNPLIHDDTRYNPKASSDGPRDTNMLQVEPTILDQRYMRTSGASLPGLAQYRLNGFVKIPTGPWSGSIYCLSTNNMRLGARNGLRNGTEQAQSDWSAPVSLRSNFSALANWSPSVVTDAQGHATIRFKMPDNLTQYRIMAVASAGTNLFGLGESSMTVSSPLTVRTSAPRFLNFGDKFELPIVVHNQSKTNLDVKLAARASNANFLGTAGRRLSVPPNNRVEVRIPVVTDRPGQANFQVIAVSGPAHDSSETSLPVYTPATTEAFATYGQIDSGAISQKVAAPPDVFTEFGGLQVTTSSTALQTLTDAFLYLDHYGFDCSEQLSSRIISIAMLRDMLKEFNASGLPTDGEIESTLQNDMLKLKARQRDDGSFGLWSLDEKWQYPFVTLHAVHALLRAKSAGIKVLEEMLEKGLLYVKNMEDHLPSDYSEGSKTELLALALYDRALSGEKDLGQQAKKIRTRQPMGEISFETLALLFNAIASDNTGTSEREIISTYFNNHIMESSSTAQLVDDRTKSYDYRMFGSTTRSNALALDAIIRSNGNQELIAKLLKSLLGGRRNGRWNSTNDNAYVLVAMRHYFDKFEHTKPDFIARAWLGDDFIGQSSFKGRSNDFKSVDVPMDYLVKNSSGSNLVLSKDGPGRLYYRIGLNYSPTNLKLEPLDRGFTVERTYESAGDKDDVRKDDNGVWHFKSGSLVRVRLRMSLPMQRNFVALVDPLPAGAEALNEALRGTENVADKNDDFLQHFSSWWWWRWWNHQNKRDNQVELFADSVNGGSYEYSYVMNATTPGQFVVPPTKAEEMYEPETFGRSGTDTVVVE